MEIDVGFDGGIALDAAHHQQATRRVEIMLPLGDRAFGLDLEEQAVAGVHKVRLAIDSSAGHAGFFDAGVVGIIEKVNRRRPFADLKRHVKAGPGDAALDGGAGLFFGEIADGVVGVSRVHQAIDRAGDALHGMLLDSGDRINQRADVGFVSEIAGAAVAVALSQRGGTTKIQGCSVTSDLRPLHRTN